MPIHRERDYLVSYDLHDTPTLYFESARIAAYTAEARQRRIPGVGGSRSFGFTETNLDFLGELPWVERVWFWDVSLDNIDGIYALKGLRDFGVHPTRPGMDFARFPELRVATIFFNARDTNIEHAAKLTSLALFHFNPRSRQFTSLRLPSALEELELSWANPRSLEGLPFLPKLKALSIHRCRNLESLSALPRIAPNLEKLVITTSGKVKDVIPIGTMPQLRFARLDGRDLLAAV